MRGYQSYAIPRLVAEERLELSRQRHRVLNPACLPYSTIRPLNWWARRESNPHAMKAQVPKTCASAYSATCPWSDLMDATHLPCVRRCGHCDHLSLRPENNTTANIGNGLAGFEPAMAFEGQLFYSSLCLPFHDNRYPSGCGLVGKVGIEPT